MPDSTLLTETVDQYLCAIIRGDADQWATQGNEEFQRAFIQRAVYHGVQALVYSRLAAVAAWDGWPDTVKDELLKAFRVCVVNDMLRAHALEEILAKFSQQEIPVLFIKGEALARTVYEQPSLRSRCDTDIFISLRNIQAVRTILMKLGFRIVTSLYKSHQFVCVKDWGEASISLDVHWRIQNASHHARVISFEDALKEAVPIAGFRGGWALGPEDSLILACMHRKGNQAHDENRLIWLYDIHVLVSSLTALQLENLIKKIAEHDLNKVCIDGLRAAMKCFHSEGIQPVIDALESNCSVNPSGSAYSSSHLALLMDDLKCLPGYRAKAGLLSELFFPPPVFLMRKYEKTNRLWLPLLYAQQMFGGLAKRLSLH